MKALIEVLPAKYMISIDGQIYWAHTMYAAKTVAMEKEAEDIEIRVIGNKQKPRGK